MPSSRRAVANLSSVRWRNGACGAAACSDSCASRAQAPSNQRARWCWSSVDRRLDDVPTVFEARATTPPPLHAAVPPTPVGWAPPQSFSRESRWYVWPPRLSRRSPVSFPSEAFSFFTAVQSSFRRNGRVVVGQTDQLLNAERRADRVVSRSAHV